jgi:triosephosphate isomerase (TIM)
MRAPVLAANWKMNHGPTQAAAFMRTFLTTYGERDDRTVVFFPPAVSVTTVAAAIGRRPDVVTGVQNIHSEPSGAFTGEISAPMAADAGARLALVGHSERRHIFGERDEESGAKCAAAVRAGLAPMLCVGEKLEERERGETDGVVLRQLRAGLAKLASDEVPRVLIAYEPVWAIGTGRTATPGDASTVHGVIRRCLRDLVGRRADDIPLLYGGSVKPENARALLDAPEVDGLLVGGASLDARAWLAIVET